MEIYLFRHGIAEDAPAGQPDSSRKLTDEGKEKTAAVAKMARAADVNPSAIISSPYDRAIETARIAAEELGFKGKLITAQELVPHGSPENVWNVIRERREDDSILLAGHEPLLSRLVAYLLASPALRVEMKKSALVRIDVDSLRGAPQGILRWMLIPKLTNR
jgi:phosphohistidine phosphatase